MKLSYISALKKSVGYYRIPLLVKQEIQMRSSSSINTITQFMVQKEKNAYIKVTQKNDVIEIEHKNSPKIDIDIISKRKSL